MNLPIIHPSHSHWKREDMPQIEDIDEFEAYLHTHGVGFRRDDLSPVHLHATQNEINLELVFRLIYEGLDTHVHPLIVSNDGHILDGHNRWYAGMIIKQPLHCIIVDREIRSLLHLALQVPNIGKETINKETVR